jgi:hypothetical protein
MATNPKALDDEAWKERFAFMSGNVLVLGVFLLQLWPFASHFQTGLNIHAYTVNLPQQGVKTELWFFWLITGVLSAAMCSVVLALFHILGRGIQLGLLTGDTDEASSSPLVALLGRCCNVTYGSAFFLTAVVCFLLAVTVPVLLVSTGLERFMISTLGWSLKLSGWIARLVIMVLLLGSFGAVFYQLYRKLGSNIFKLLENPGVFTLKSFFVTAVLFFAIYFPVIEFCCATDLTLEHEFVTGKAGEPIQISVVLGGATSDVNLAKVSLIGPDGSSTSLNLQSLGRGRYVAWLAPDKLAAGRHEVVLEYPHAALDAAFPLIHLTTRKSNWIIIVP